MAVRIRDITWRLRNRRFSFCRIRLSADLWFAKRILPRDHEIFTVKTRPLKPDGNRYKGCWLSHDPQFVKFPAIPLQGYVKVLKHQAGPAIKK
jgi:hypothetical protein